PWLRRRKPSSLTFSLLLIDCSGSENFMPASSSCASSLSTGVASTVANCLIVTSDIICPLLTCPRIPDLGRNSVSGMSRDGGFSTGSGFPRRHNQFRRAFLVDAFDGEFDQLVRGKV